MSNGKIAKKEDYDAREEECCGFVGFFEFVGLVGVDGPVGFCQRSGGAPQLDGIFWQVATTGALSFNNTNETIFLRGADAYLIDWVHYASEGNNDQSLTRCPEGTSLIFVEHKSLPQSAGASFSPGTGVDGRLLVVSPVEPGGRGGSRVADVTLRASGRDGDEAQINRQGD